MNWKTPSNCFKTREAFFSKKPQATLQAALHSIWAKFPKVYNKRWFSLIFFSNTWCHIHIWKTAGWHRTKSQALNFCCRSFFATTNVTFASCFGFHMSPTCKKLVETLILRNIQTQLLPELTENLLFFRFQNTYVILLKTLYNTSQTVLGLALQPQ